MSGAGNRFRKKKRNQRLFKRLILYYNVSCGLASDQPAKCLQKQTALHQGTALMTVERLLTRRPGPAPSGQGGPSAAFPLGVDGREPAPWPRLLMSAATSILQKLGFILSCLQAGVKTKQRNGRYDEGNLYTACRRPPGCGAGGPGSTGGRDGGRSDQGGAGLWLGRTGQRQPGEQHRIRLRIPAGLLRPGSGLCGAGQDRLQRDQDHHGQGPEHLGQRLLLFQFRQWRRGDRQLSPSGGDLLLL